MNIEDKVNLAKLPQPVVEHIKQLERVRSDFVANVSHELRTPLTVIRGYLETLMKKNDTQIPSKIFQQMYQHSIRMENIIDELLLLSRLESEDKTHEEKQPIAVSAILTTLCEDAINVSGEKKHKIKLTTDKTLGLKGSEGELKSLFSNLIINAVKYTPPKGSIEIFWQSQDNGDAVFAVKDTGIGIAEEHIPRITERFYRVDKARSRDSGGTGLGLAIAKHVLMRHEAELRVQSTFGKGSLF